ncbi:hypothetical protein HJFPF1_05322 [Paramyrothecium foliicola]|nr:hypothetical protein HJFPF1_05322 [Paramyrothecium foliicola]
MKIRNANTMPATLSSDRPPARHDDLDNYNVDDFSDDPFASPTPPGSPKKRKEPDSGLGIDEEVSVKKRARAPAVKLDEDRLLGPAGLPKLRARAQGLKLKGKGHEFSDASRLLSFYQLWLDDLFPKAKFVDALAMVEKVGHKKRVMAARNEFINQSRPKDRTEYDDDDDLFGEGNDAQEAEVEPELPGDDAPSASTIQRPRTPQGDDAVPDDDDLYDATPRRAQTAARPPPPTQSHDIPDDDELDMLMAEYGAPGESAPLPPKPQQARPVNDDVPDDDDLDALVAEAEEFDRGNQKELAVRSDPKEVTSNKGASEAPQGQEEELEGLWD